MTGLTLLTTVPEIWGLWLGHHHDWVNMLTTVPEISNYDYFNSLSLRSFIEIIMSFSLLYLLQPL